MIENTNELQRPFELSPRTVVALVVLFAVGIALKTGDFYLKTYDSSPTLLDFDIFYMAGLKVWDGSLIEAYDFEEFSELQRNINPHDTPMTWTYPPQFAAFAAVLALAPAWLSYLLFTSICLASYLLILRRIAAEHFSLVLLGIFPVILANLACGQNGLLTGSLVGLFALMALRGAGWAGVPIGLMVIKPHLAIGIGVWLLLSRNWAWVVQAACLVVGTSVFATLLFGTAVWAAFFDAAEQAKTLLETGSYMLFRMTSVYAGLKSLGVGARTALVCQMIVAVCGLAFVVLVCALGWTRERTLAVAILASLLISPYNYDYDLAMLGVAAALVAKDLAQLRAGPFLITVCGLTWASSGYGLLGTVMASLASSDEMSPSPVALAGFTFFLLALVISAVLWRCGTGRS